MKECYWCNKKFDKTYFIVVRDKENKLLRMDFCKQCLIDIGHTHYTGEDRKLISYLEK